MATSNCSLGVEVDFYWYGTGPMAVPGIDLAVQSLMAAASGPTRRWNPYNAILTRREFVKRLEAACRGELVPVDEVKAIEDPEAESVFEIRWSGITVTEQHGDEPQVRHVKVEMRLLHAEPQTESLVAIALHAHEKVVVEGDPQATRRAQNAEIHEATRRYNVGRPVRWGLPAR